MPMAHVLMSGVKYCFRHCAFKLLVLRERRVEKVEAAQQCLSILLRLANHGSPAVGHAVELRK